MSSPANASSPAFPSSQPLVLVVDDEEPIRRFLRASLEAHGHRVKEAATAREGALLAVTAHPDVILLDLGLPDADGLTVARSLRRESSVPIIVLSARGQESDKVLALDAGADDYLTKPFGVGELLARIRVALRHAARGGTPDGATGSFRATIGGRTVAIDAEARLVHVDDGNGPREVRLTPLEYKLLAFMARHAGKVLTHAMLLREVWGPQHVHDVQYLRVYAGELRKKLERDASQPMFIITEPGVGYRLMEAGGAGDAPA